MIAVYIHDVLVPRHRPVGSILTLCTIVQRGLITQALKIFKGKLLLEQLWIGDVSRPLSAVNKDLKKGQPEYVTDEKNSTV